MGTLPCSLVTSNCQVAVILFTPRSASVCRWHRQAEKVRAEKEQECLMTVAKLPSSSPSVLDLLPFTRYSRGCLHCDRISVRGTRQCVCVCVLVYSESMFRCDGAQVIGDVVDVCRGTCSECRRCSDLHRHINDRREDTDPHTYTFICHSLVAHQRA